MGKLFNGLLLIFAIDVALVLFLGVTTPTKSLFLLITGGMNWNDLSFVSILQAAILLASVVGIVVGTFLRTPDAFYVMAAFVGVLFSYTPTVFELHTRLAAFGYFSDNPYILYIIIAPLVLGYIYVVLKFWRGAD